MKPMHDHEHNQQQIEARLSGEEGGVRHAFFTRNGGASEGVFQSLNCRYGSSDSAERVTENRAIVARRMGVAPEALMLAQQRHTSTATIVETPWRREDAPVADALVTARPGLAVAVQTADCAPVLFADPEARVVGAAHAGWRGARGGVIEASLAAMESLGARRSRIRAVVGPTISQANYEVGEDFRRDFVEIYPAAAAFFIQSENRPLPHFDLPGFIVNLLEQGGVGEISNLALCTCANDSLFFSYRRSQQRKEPGHGCQISAILIL
jgi:polyphenol oxidase